MLLERLEDRRLLAGPELLAVRPDEGPLLQADDVLHVAPRELNLLFKGGADINPATIDGNVRLVRGGPDGQLGTTDDVQVDLGYLGLNDPANNDPADRLHIVLRPASFSPHNSFRPEASFPDDLFRIEIIGAGPSGNRLEDNAGNAFNDGQNFQLDFELDLGAQIVSVSPQPVSHNTQQVALTGGSLGGTFTLRFDAGSGVEKTGAIATNAPANVNQVQTLTVPAGSTGNFELQFNGVNTGSINHNDAAGDVEAALAGLPDIEAADIVVSGGPLDTDPVTIEFTGQYAPRDVPLLVVVNPTMSAGDPTIESLSDTVTPVRAQLENLNGIQPGDVRVSGIGPTWAVTFQGHFAGEQTNLLQGDPAGLTGVNPSISVNRLTQLSQARDQIVVYLNDDDLDPTDATNPTFYRLVDLNAPLDRTSVDESNDTLLLPDRVTYDAEDDRVVLTFKDPIPEGTYRLDIGSSDEDNGTPDDAVNVGSLFSSLAFQEVAYLGDTGGSSTDGSDDDYYRIRLAAGSVLTVKTMPDDPLLDLEIELVNGDGSTITAPPTLPSFTDQVAGSTTPDQLDWASVAADGEYLVRVGSVGDASTGSYSIDIGVTGNTIEPVGGDDDNSSFATATPLGTLGAGGVSHRAQIEPQSIAMPT
ncbi:MAG: hypothetical protein ACC628_02850, partial [Pirellulaceae bacterium]